MDLVLGLAAPIGADLAIANDPDADRCAVAIPDRRLGWRTLRGDEVGVLLADHLMRRGVRGLYATTIVSSSLLGTMCAARGMAYAETLTGFKWIVRAAATTRPRWCTGTRRRSATVSRPGTCGTRTASPRRCWWPSWPRGLKARRAHARRSAGRDRGRVRRARHRPDLDPGGPACPTIDETMARLRAKPPGALIGEAVTSIEDLAPRADVVTVRTATCRVVVRPSGTEPKLKAYLEVVAPVQAGGGRPRLGQGDVSIQDVPAARDRAANMIAVLRTEIMAVLAGQGTAIMAG